MPHSTAIGKNWSYYCSVDMACLYKGGSLGRCYESREGGALPSYLDTGFPNMRALSELTVYMNAEDFDL